MVPFLKNLKLMVKVSLLGAGSVVVTAAILVGLAVWQSGLYNNLAQQEVDALISADLDHITQGIYNLIHAENDAVQQQINYDLNVARYVLSHCGKVSLSEETVPWSAINQYSDEEQELELPKMFVGGQWLGQIADPTVEVVAVDEISKLLGETATIFQRMNERGDMLRVATTVKNTEGLRAIGTYIPAVNPDGNPNPVISSVLKGEIYHGIAYVVNAWYLTAYEPILDDSNRLVGMLYVGMKQKQVEERVRQAILNTQVGKTGYVYVLGGRGEHRGHYIISQRSERDGEDIWNQVDSDGQLVIQSIVNQALSLQPGKMATERYRWQNPGEVEPRWKIARLAYFAPWDWVIGTSVYEDELQLYRSVLADGRIRMIRVMEQAGLAITIVIGLIGILIAWTITRPIQQLTQRVERIIQGDLDQVVEIHSRDEIGSLADTFNLMTRRLKQSLDALRQSEEQYRGIFENALEGIFQTSFGGRFINVNVAMARILGFDSPEELIATYTNIRQELYVRPTDRDDFVDGILERGSVFEQKYQFYRKDRQIIWISITARAVRDEEGYPSFIEGFMMDITERVRSEEALRASEEYFKQLVENSPVAMVVSLGLEEKVLLVNKKFTELFGYTLKDIPDVSFWWPLVYPDEEYREKVKAEWMVRVAKAIRDHNEIEPLETRIVCKGGTIRFVEIHLASMGGKNLITFVDLTGRKRVEEELRTSEERLRLKLDSILQPEIDLSKQELSNIIDVPALQSLMDDFYVLTNMATAILDPKGNILEATGWQDICVNFHRVCPESAQNCRESDLILTQGVLPGEYKGYKCKNNLWDVVSPLYIGSKHIANIFAGQFFYAEEMVDEAVFIEQAKKYGFDQDAYMEALQKVPRLNRKEVDSLVGFLTKLGTMISNLSAGNLALTKSSAEQKLIAEAFRESEEKYRELVQSANSIILRLDSDGKITFFNEYAQHFFGYSEDEVLGQNIVGLLVPEVDSSGRILRSLVDDIVRNPEKYVTHEVECIRRSGEQVHVLWTNKPVFNQWGDTTEILCIGNDVTGLKKLEEQLMQSQKMEAIGKLAGGISHDFNNLLTIILGYSDLALHNLETNSPIYHAIEEIKKSGERAATLTRQLLAYSRKQVLKPQFIDLNELILNMDTMLRRLIGEDIELVTLPALDLGSMKADPSQIEQIIMNLAINARDAISNGGHLTIETANAVLDEDYAQTHVDVKAGSYIMLAVSDNGGGMDAETLKQIFEPFYTTKEKGKGTGLGLSTVYGIVKQSGGHIYVYSELNRGSTFKIYFPRLDNTEAENQDALDMHSLQTIGKMQGTETILVVEDEEMVRSMVSQMLQDQGYTVLAAGYYSEALQLFEHHSGEIDLLITDIVLPKMSGPEIASRLTALRPNLTVLYMSGYTDNAIVQHGILNKEIAFIQKPFTPFSFLQKVREILDNPPKHL